MAKEKNLVDELGGFTRAIEIAKELAAIPKKDKIQLVVLPRPRTFMQILSSPRNSEDDPHYNMDMSPFDFTTLTSYIFRRSENTEKEIQICAYLFWLFARYTEWNSNVVDVLSTGFFLGVPRLKHVP
jgi:ClpP class serine protease